MKKNADSKTRNQGNRKLGNQGLGKQGNREIGNQGNRKLGNQGNRNFNSQFSILNSQFSILKTKHFSLTLVLALAFSFFLPWWSVMLAAFLAGAIVRLKNVTAFFVPFLATSLFWIAYAWVLSSSNDFILAKKISVLFSMKGNAWLLLLLTGVIGGLSAGVAGVFGNQVRAAFSKIHE